MSPTSRDWSAIVWENSRTGAATAMSNVKTAVVEFPSLAVYVNSAFVNTAVVVPVTVRAVALNVSPPGNVVGVNV